MNWFEAKVSQDLKKEVLKDHNYTCIFCRHKGNKKTILVCNGKPVTRGGHPSHRNNLIVCCRTCATKKGLKTTVEFRRWLKREKERSEGLPLEGDHYWKNNKLEVNLYTTNRKMVETFRKQNKNHEILDEFSNESIGYIFLLKLGVGPVYFPCRGEISRKTKVVPQND